MLHQIVNTEELAHRLNVSPATVRAWRRRGWISCFRSSRRKFFFDVDEVRQALLVREWERQQAHD